MLKMSSLSVDPAYWLGKILPYVPTPKKSSPRGKIVFSSVLALIFLFLCVPLKSVKNPYEGDMRAFSPSQQAREILKNNGKDGPQATLDYIAFYQNLPNAKMDAELEKIKAEAEANQSLIDKNINKLKDILKNKLGEDKEQFVELMLTFMPAAVDPSSWMDLFRGANVMYGYVRALLNNENINSVDFAVDSVGLIVGVAAVVPGAGIPAKQANKAITPVRKVWKKIPQKVKQQIAGTFTPVVNIIKNSDLMEVSLADFADRTALVDTKKYQLDKVIKQTQDALAQLGPIREVSAKSEPVAEVIMLNSQTPEELKNNLKLAKEFGKEDMPILQFGGAEALRAAARLQKRGEFNPQVLKAAMSYGPAGLNAVGHVPSSDILKGDFSSRRAYSWLQILLLVLYIPYFCLAMIKIWRPELAHAGGVKEA